MDKDKIEQAKSALALSLIAAYHDVESAKTLAQEQGTPFNRDIALSYVREFAGEDKAKDLAKKWPTLLSDVLDRLNKILVYSNDQIAMFSQYVLGNDMTLAGGFRNAQGEVIDLPDIAYSLTTQNGCPAIDLRFNTDIPESLRKVDAYRVFVDGKPVQVTDVRWNVALGADKIRIRLEPSTLYDEKCKCEIGVNPQTNELVAIFLTTRVPGMSAG